MSIKIISNYIADDEKRSAMVYKVLETGKYKVSVTNDSGSTFSTTFDDVDSAENYAEDWVMNK